MRSPRRSWPIFLTTPSVTATTGEPSLAKMSMPRRESFDVDHVGGVLALLDAAR